MPQLPYTREHDADLISESLHRPEAFAALYDRHAPAIHRFAARRLGDQVADDVVADTFLAAFRVRERYDLDRTDARPWLYGIASRLIGRHRRAEVRMWRAISRSGVDAYADTDADAGRIEERLSAGGTQRALAVALARLSPQDRNVLLLVAWAELSYEEVARALEIPIGTVRSRLNRARRQLREELDRLQPGSLAEELCHERT